MKCLKFILANCLPTNKTSSASSSSISSFKPPANHSKISFLFSPLNRIILLMPSSTPLCTLFFFFQNPSKHSLIPFSFFLSSSSQLVPLKPFSHSPRFFSLYSQLFFFSFQPPFLPLSCHLLFLLKKTSFSYLYTSSLFFSKRPLFFVQLSKHPPAENLFNHAPSLHPVFSFFFLFSL